MRAGSVALVWMFVLSVAGGCGRGWVPDLVLRGEVAHKGRVSASEDRWRERSAWRWRAGVAARWEPRRGPPAEGSAPGDGGARVRSGPPPPVRCRSAQLCAWERRARRQALAVLEGGAR